MPEEATGRAVREKEKIRNGEQIVREREEVAIHASTGGASDCSHGNEVRMRLMLVLQVMLAL